MIALPNKQLTSLAIFAVQSWTKVYHNNFFVFKVRFRAQFRSPKCARVTFVQYRYISFFYLSLSITASSSSSASSSTSSTGRSPLPTPTKPSPPHSQKKKLSALCTFVSRTNDPSPPPQKLTRQTCARSLSVSLPASSLADRHALRPFPPPPSSSSLVSEGSDDARRTAEQGEEETIIRKEEEEDVGHLRAISIPSYSDPPPSLNPLSVCAPSVSLFACGGDFLFPSFLSLSDMHLV